MQAAKAELGRSHEIQSIIWTQAIDASRLLDSHPNAAKLLLPALNEMFDVTTRRTMAARIDPPAAIYVLMFGLGLWCALLAGHAMACVKPRSWFDMIGFAGFIAIAVFVILEIEYPRRGLIRINAYDQVLVELRDSMK